MDKTQLQTMETYLHEHIPITAHFAVKIIAFEKGTIHLRAPLAANINHRDTAFGGSLSSIGILAGWSVIHFTLTALGLPSRIVIQSSSMDFTAPGDADFDATASLPDEVEWNRFCNMLKRKGRARIRLPSSIHIGDTSIAEHEGVFVAILNDRL
ncbi:putative thioesterase [Mariprofundus micogutta]|uniref:Putative thioesterase n=1 Tax=Mariprofundus micogutta TaxID=1921010 RepID=A0A1L8CQS3_9PROT|nr:YiiD C-terminal domain-containing protein [Mariprofundus micogutta]GAV21268.1 putative thioesterase [Mariprofundus micogutta]